MSAIVHFGPGSDTGKAARDLLGNKGAGLVAMSAVGHNVPPGFIIPTTIGKQLTQSQDDVLGQDLSNQVAAALARVETAVGRRLGDPLSPLLVSVRSGAAVSMPGMMDTVLNLGINLETVEGLIRETGNARFAWDTYRRFVQNFSQVVLNIDTHDFELVLEEARSDYDCETDSALPAEAMEEVARTFVELASELAGAEFPENPRAQLEQTLLAVFASWNSQRAVKYRELHNIDAGLGTAAIVQAMVFGNRDSNSATGVCFTRNPSTAKKELFGEFIVNAQGEDVVSGMRTPAEITEVARLANMSTEMSMERRMPETFKELSTAATELEMFFRDMQEIEFTVESGRLWILQSRDGKRTQQAALSIAVQLAEEQVISPAEALERVDSHTIDGMLQTRVVEANADRFATRGLPASPGAVSGVCVFTSNDAVESAKNGKDCILVRAETDPKDIHGMDAAIGILTSRGGLTSHAAVVARGMGKPCVTAAKGLRISEADRKAVILTTEFSEGDVLTIDGASGQVWIGAQPIETPEPDGELAKLLAWRDETAV